jgi:hypothetical protein
MTAVRRFLAETRTDVVRLPLPLRVSISSALILGAIGGLCGLMVGLVAHPPTAWFAVLEVGLPAAAVGGAGGLVVGGLLWVVRRPTRDPGAQDRPRQR